MGVKGKWYLAFGNLNSDFVGFVGKKENEMSRVPLFSVKWAGRSHNPQRVSPPCIGLEYLYWLSISSIALSDKRGLGDSRHCQSGKLSSQALMG